MKLKQICLHGLLLIFLLSESFACTFTPEPFCSTVMNTRPDDVIIAGVISGVDTLGINIEIVTILRGTENRTNVRIWDGTDFDCNGFFSMAAADIGNVNDSIIIALPKIDSLENQWDVLGDYRRPEPYTLTTSLAIKNGFVEGFITGSHFGGIIVDIGSFKYTEFIQSFTNEQSCDRIVNTSQTHLNKLKIYPNPVNEILIIESDRDDIISLYIYGYNGIITAIIDASSNHPINLSYLPTGVYAILTDKKELVKRFIKI